MHVETELDEIHSERLLELQKRLNKPLSDIVSDILTSAIDARLAPPESEGEKVLRILDTHGLLGCMEGDGQLSVEYKKHLWGKP